jgi:hypothetical protein
MQSGIALHLEILFGSRRGRDSRGGRVLCAGYDVLSRCGQIISLGNRLGHQSTWYQLNYFVSNQDVPEEARPIIEETMLAEFSFHETDIVAHFYSDEIESTARVVHASNYDSTIMRGLFKTFYPVSRVVCGRFIVHLQLIQHNLSNPLQI